jgi:aminoglycoside phosphotransferase (APT) family kinase protein
VVIPGDGTPHGFGDDAHSRWLRSRPPAQALDWVERSVGGRVVGVRAYRGGSSSAMHGVRVQQDDGRRTVVLRRYVIARLVEEEPDIAQREADVLRLLEATDLPTPSLFAVDASGADVAVPALLMSRLPGRVEWSPGDLSGWLRQLAELLPRLHAAAAGDDVQEFRPYEPQSWQPPEWLQDKRLWERALAIFHGPRLDPDRVFLHRDYHPGNVLWARGRISGVVDWQAASMGPRCVDVWHCRGNLLSRFGEAVADEFVRAWEDASGLDYNPWAETVMLVDAVGWIGPRGDAERRTLEALLARRVSELSG